MMTRSLLGWFWLALCLLVTAGVGYSQTLIEVGIDSQRDRA